ncbi:DUF2079 domain-containing protein [Patulibacter sp. NPDC049589]|uniref:DUF2079 domain-containing protein n=1 Tax=Patulibacter sp. NPDC049589 TaxID=3154731 RepID=UPI003418DB4F
MRTLRIAARRPRDPGLVVVLVAAALLSLAYAVWAWQRHRWYLTSGYDLGIFDQATRNLAHLRAPASSLREVPNLWGDHFHPIIVLWGALKVLWPSPVALLASQAVLVAAAMIPLYLLARDRAGMLAGVFLALAYGTSWGVQRAIDFDVHELAFAPALLACAVLAADRERWRWFWVSAVLLLCVKEDVALVVVALGLWLALEGERRRGAIAIVAGLAWFVLATRWWIPGLGVQEFTYWSYYRFGQDAPSAIGAAVTHPWRLVTVAVDPKVKLDTMLALVAPFLVLTPWLTRLAVLPLPLFAERFLSDQDVYWGTSFHYSLLPTMTLAIASAGGIATVRRALERRAAVLGRAGAAPLRTTPEAVVSTAASSEAAGMPAALPQPPGAPAAPPEAGDAPAALSDGAQPRGGASGPATAQRRWSAAARLAPAVLAGAGLIAGTVAWFPVYGHGAASDGPPLAALATLHTPPRIVDRHVLDRVVAAVPTTGSVAVPRTMQPHLTERDQPVHLLESRDVGHTPHVTTDDNVVVDLTDPAPDAVALPERVGVVVDATDARLARGGLVPVWGDPEGWVVLRSPSAPGGTRVDPALGVLPVGPARALRAAANAWGRTLRATAADCAITCTSAAKVRLDAAGTALDAAVTRAAGASPGVCAPILRGVAGSGTELLRRRAAITAAPGDPTARVQYRDAVEGRLSGAVRRAAMVCAPGAGPPGRGLPAPPAAPGTTTAPGA